MKEAGHRFHLKPWLTDSFCFQPPQHVVLHFGAHGALYKNCVEIPSVSLAPFIRMSAVAQSFLVQTKAQLSRAPWVWQTPPKSTNSFSLEFTFYFSCNLYKLSTNKNMYVHVLGIRKPSLQVILWIAFVQEGQGPWDFKNIWQLSGNKCKKKINRWGSGCSWGAENTA